MLHLPSIGIRPIAIIFLFIFYFQANAQTMDFPSVFMEELTWTEVQKALNHGYKTILLPAGGTEQNGPHMVLGKHNVRVKYMAGKIAQKLGDALVAPVISYVPEGGIEPPTSHMRFAGTIHLPEEHYMKLLEYAARSFKKHGFTDIVMIFDSGPDWHGMYLVSEQLNSEWEDTQVRVHFVNELYRAPDEELIRDSLKISGIPEEAFGKHAGLYDVSYSLAIDSSLIRHDKIKELSDDAERNLKLGFSGNPSLASKEIGEKFMEAKIKACVDKIILLKKESRE